IWWARRPLAACRAVICAAPWPSPADELTITGTVILSGQTTLDRVHQAMLLFAAGRSDALKSFLVTASVGQDAAFWRLAQALSALYAKRWVDGVHGRKKGLGF
ncbi:MAG: DUF1156 domain-containing protein, partial [Anaerolineae bacterium]|nr:DUF1156 domain-containing protein [Anaerolineae bacterium]